MQTPGKLSMLRLRRFVRYLLGAADVGPFFAYQDEPNTVLVWTDGDWSGNAVTCKSTSAGAVQLGSHTIETWSVNQQVVSLSSAESEFYAIGSGCARGRTVKHVLQEILHTVSPDSDVKMTIRTDSDAARGMIHRVGCGRVRHLQTRYLWHQQALREGQFNVVRCGTKQNPSDLGTKVLEREAMASCMSKLAIIPSNTLRGAIVAALTRVTSASNNVITDGCCSTREGNTTSEVNTAGSVSTFAASAGAGGAVVVMMLIWRAAMSKHSAWNRQTRSSAEAQSIP